MREFWLKQAGDEQDKALVQRLWDLKEQVETRQAPAFTFFLDPVQQLLAQRLLATCQTTVAWQAQGGFAGEPERRRLLLYPAEWAEFDFRQEGVAVVRVEGRFQFFRPGHRDLLGSLLAAGVKRELVGDIHCTEDGNWAAVAVELLPVLKSQWDRVGPVPITIMIEENPPLLKRPPGQERLISLASPRLDGLLAQGVGVYLDGQTILYRWDGRAFVPIWQRTTAGGGRQGAGFGSRMGEAVWLEDVDGNGQAEILLKHIEGMQDTVWTYRAVNYLLQLPGALAFRWDGEAYVPGYFVDEGRVIPVRPRLPLIFAPRLSYPLIADGDLSDWAQIEYWHSLELKREHGLSRPGATVAWDEQFLYLTAEVVPGQILTIALDTDLSGDFGNVALNADDVLLEAALPASLDCQNPVIIRLRYPQQETLRAQAAARPLPYAAPFCTLELAIPLDTLGLDERTLVPEIGWVIGGLEPDDLREYHPRAGQIIGFAIAVNGRGSTPGFRPDDPTTWSTLIFIADR